MKIVQVQDCTKPDKLQLLLCLCIDLYNFISKYPVCFTFYFVFYYIAGYLVYMHIRTKDKLMQFNYCSIAKNKITGNTFLKGDNITERIMEIKGEGNSLNEFDFWFANCCHAELVIQESETLQDTYELQVFSIEQVTLKLFQLEWYHVWPNELHNQCFDDMTIVGDFARYKWNWCHVIYSGGYPEIKAILKVAELF